MFIKRMVVVFVSGVKFFLRGVLCPDFYKNNVNFVQNLYVL